MAASGTTIPKGTPHCQDMLGTPWKISLKAKPSPHPCIELCVGSAMHPGWVILIPVSVNYYHYYYCCYCYQCSCAGTALLKLREEGKSGFPLAEPQAGCPAHHGPSAHS